MASETTITNGIYNNNNRVAIELTRGNIHTKVPIIIIIYEA